MISFLAYDGEKNICDDLLEVLVKILHNWNFLV